MNIEISKERMLEMAKKLASMDFCPEQRVFYKNILRMVKADTEGRLLVLPCKVGDTVYEILEETVPNHYFYISEHKVQDVSVRCMKSSKKPYRTTIFISANGRCRMYR